MKLRCLGDFVELRQGLAINKGSAHLVSDIQDITYCYPLLRIADMMDSNFSKFVSKDVNSSVIANPQDIIYTRTGQIGLAFRGMQGVVHNNSFIVSLKTDELEKDYLYTVLNSNFVKKQAISQAKNSVQPDLTHTMFKSMVIPIPGSKKEQNRISKIINNINQKIQINNQINQELEAIAKTLYDYWFVQFDFPDQNGKPYKSSGGKMVYNPELKREIPEGWGVEKLSHFLTIKNGKDHKHLQDGKFAVYGSGGIMRMVTDYLYSGESILFPRKGTLNNVMYVNEKFWTVDTMFYSEVNKNNSSLYVFYSVKDIDFNKLNTGTGVPSMTSSILYDLNIIVPEENILEKFNTIVKQNYETIKLNSIQNQELTQLRDWLLPMLMNGQVKVE